MKVITFGEGRTDERVFSFLREKYLSVHEFQDFVSVNGKANFKKLIKGFVASELVPNKETSILVFRDLDRDEEQDRVVQSFHDIVKELLPGWNREPDRHLDYPNIYFFEQESNEETPGFHMVLHLADINHLDLPERLKNSNKTTDGYVLAVGLKKDVLNRFAVKDVGTSVEKLNSLITEAIPSGFSLKDIAFEEDKDYLAAYLCATRFWVKKRTEDRERLEYVILDRAWKYNQESVRNVFATWIAAMIKSGGSQR